MIPTVVFEIKLFLIIILVIFCPCIQESVICNGNLQTKAQQKSAMLSNNFCQLCALQFGKDIQTYTIYFLRR